MRPTNFSLRRCPEKDMDGCLNRSRYRQLPIRSSYIGSRKQDFVTKALRPEWFCLDNRIPYRTVRSIFLSLSLLPKNINEARDLLVLHISV